MKLGRYKVVETLKTKGFFQLYKAYHRTLDRIVILKGASKELPDETLNRFKKEGAFLASLSHPNVVQIYDTFERNNTVFLVLEYVEGLSLERLIEIRRTISPEVACYIIYSCLKALNVAHQNGILHRDIKPSNILISKEGLVKVTDFGIARDIAEPHITQPGTVLGTPYYMPPEVVKGEEATERSDLFSVGVVLYEMLTGEKPFYGKDTTSVLLKIQTETPRLPKKISRKIPRKLKKILNKAMNKKPEKRFRNVEDMLSECEKFLGEKFIANAESIFKKFIEESLELSETITWEMEELRWKYRFIKKVKVFFWTIIILLFLFISVWAAFKFISYRVFGSLSFSVQAPLPSLIYLEDIGFLSRSNHLEIGDLPPGIYRFRIENSQGLSFYDVDLKRKENVKIPLNFEAPPLSGGEKASLFYRDSKNLFINGEKIEQRGEIPLELNLPYLIQVKTQDTTIFQTFLKLKKKKRIILNIKSLPELYPSKVQWVGKIRLLFLNIFH